MTVESCRDNKWYGVQQRGNPAQMAEDMKIQWWQPMRIKQADRRVKAEAQGQSERGKFVLTS
ncbi:uncharacterized protein TrAtP1_004797 [Trichoderma atroviride]|uniref:uncharacterized protein n=1 Tax=Hypocrea atroviridis TaxID=63577 RepID=UPI0033307A69|nr:hypothetical protein TrAtP1_004797 [Trichoderma atroviride]